MTLEDRIKLAVQKIQPILAEYKVDMGTEHFLKKDVKSVTNFLDLIDSRIVWLDRDPSPVSTEHIQAVDEVPTAETHA